jgi:glucose-1-phosphate cytidylyltransferase
MKVVILCGGKAIRLRKETEFQPKPMLPIGRQPILQHVMKIYAHYRHPLLWLQGGDDSRVFFAICLWDTCDTALKLGHASGMRFHDRHDEEDWTVTSERWDTGHRIKVIQKSQSRRNLSAHLRRRVADIDISESIRC